MLLILAPAWVTDPKLASLAITDTNSPSSEPNYPVECSLVSPFIGTNPMHRNYDGRHAITNLGRQRLACFYISSLDLVA